MNVLLSIKPEYSEKIFDGKKTFEFRKTNIKEDVEEVWVYESRPTQKIVGKFKVKVVLCDAPARLWKQCNGSGGISRSDFDQYFKGKSIGYAFKISNAERFESAIEPKEIFSKFYPPQNLMYFEFAD
jgi:predicted transcriptional regulator